MNFDFFGIPLDGTPPQFVERLLRNGRLDTTQGIETENDDYVVYVHVPEICYGSIPLYIQYNHYTSMVYSAFISIADDIGLSNYSRLFEILVERYGDEYNKLPNKEVLSWHFDEGRILLFRSDTTTVLSFSDVENNPEVDCEDVSDDEQYLIE